MEAARTAELRKVFAAQYTGLLPVAGLISGYAGDGELYAIYIYLTRHRITDLIETRTHRYVYRLTLDADENGLNISAAKKQYKEYGYEFVAADPTQLTVTFNDMPETLAELFHSLVYRIAGIPVKFVITAKLLSRDMSRLAENMVERIKDALARADYTNYINCRANCNCSRRKNLVAPK